MKQVRVIIHPEVRTALRRGRAVVALESAAITTGLPRAPFVLPPHLAIDGWNPKVPANLALAQLLDRTVRSHNALPAMVAVIDGSLHLGLTPEQTSFLASDPQAGKVSIANLAAAIGQSRTAGTTVAATLLACRLTDAEPIRVFATGGIGGVHRHWQQEPDISADIRAIATTQTCIVCAGAKSILDLPATLAAIEALGVPVVGWKSDSLAQFYTRNDTSLRLSQRADSIAEVAALCVAHWFTLQQASGVLLSNPIEERFAIDGDEVSAALANAETAAAQKSIRGALLTPFLLGELVHRTGGRSLAANIALLRSNAALAAQLAVELARITD